MKIQLIIFALFAVISTAFTQCTPPCVNGSCQPGNACRCNTGWTDSRCDVALCTGFGNAQCGPGKCVAPDVCNCTGTEYTGEACTIPICPTPCQNGGICNAPDSCNCAGTGYTGKYCDAPICNAPIGCGPGTCIAAEVCDCDDGWTGTYCTTPVCPTACENGGKCIGPDTCDCKGTGYDGKYCTTPVCDPGCLNGGECVLPDVCDCSNITGWTGDYCEQGICDNAPCQHGGRCVAPDECNCTATGYSGLQCQNEIDECSNATSPCYPGTSCTNTPGNFTCSACPSGYTGTGRLIDNGGCTDIDECLTLCDPVADCSNTPGSFTCGACPSGYTGTGLTGCVAICDNACVNGNCTAPNRCTCQPGWTGPTCNVQGPSTTGTVTGTTGVPTNSTTDGTDDEDLTESSASFVTFSVVAFFASLFFVL